jgi:enamine deaminase RidA (YjgF/YER057c/UK114 family)
MADIRFINPETLAKPPSYTHVVEVVGPCRTVHISGQLGTDLEGNVVGDFRAQAVQVFENLKAALASVGATFADVVKLNSYLADIADLPVLREVRVRYLNAEALPASTTLAVSGFARPALCWRSKRSPCCRSRHRRGCGVSLYFCCGQVVEHGTSTRLSARPL